MQQINHTDETLVLLTLAGDQSAYEALVVRYQKAVIASAIQITRSQFMAEDAAQDAFVTAWMKLNTLQQPEKYGAWVCRIAKNCALNMVTRYRSFIDFELVANTELDMDPALNPAELFELSEEKDDVQKSMGKLPEKVREIIRLHYFEGLSIAEIADRMRISEGTVKWQLHDGRKRIRKELCAMNEKYNDTLVQRVMKKVEELKLWQIKNDKSGFEKVYQDVLREVEELPESKDKNHALADVLMRGWWWLPGEKNDALFERIRDAAIKGKNDEVMEFIVTREDSKVYGSAKIEFIRDKQIPMLEEGGFVRTLGREWFWLGIYYFKENRPEEGREAFDKVLQILGPSHGYRAMVPGALKMEELLAGEYKEKSKKRYLISGFADEFRYVDGKLRYWDCNAYGEGNVESVDRNVMYLFRNASLCDRMFFDQSLAVGEAFVGTDCASLTFASDCETVETPAGVFEGCQLWTVRKIDDYYGKTVVKTWYKSGVGMVKQEHIVDGLTDVRVLIGYHIAGGDGLLPLAHGNRWEYADEYNHEFMISRLAITVAYADEERVVTASENLIERLQYDENSWLDMIQQIRNEYWIYENHNAKLGDIAVPLEKVEALAKTPMEKAHTKAAVSVVRRIVEGETPDSGYTGHWNFFSRNTVMQDKGIVKTASNFRWSFELKNIGGAGEADRPLLYNDIYGILQDAANCIWSEEWRIGAAPIVEYDRYGRAIKTHITCENGGKVTTKAGEFDNCLKLSMEIGGMTDGWEYRGGKKVYYFAEGIGIVRTENEYSDGARTAVYELTSYEGTGEGYMPLADGLVRRFDAIGLTDGYVGAVEYTYAADDEGDIVIFKDATGIRRVPEIITQYSSICGEVKEETLFSEGKWQDGHLRHAINNFKLMQHYMFRDSYHFNNNNRSVEICGFNMKLMESFGEDGEVPPAWYGIYGWTALVRSAALFDCGRKEEGYLELERAFEYYIKWNTQEPESLLEVGNHEVFGGIRLVKGKSLIQLPDGTREPIEYARRKMGYDGLCNALNSPRVWAWFNSVREEERFKEYNKRAEKLRSTIG